ncbi:FAD-binding protein [Nodosilinea sp. LEGE 07298]|uniref:FAD-binding protein n=1 Tax=Nodosilinea sp. LEGE 07298 TaxID=2777970 RepID=UPI001880EE66|nr:FAD-binding protein [Nodosilinea sp. LEGE 07298]MBE9109960.1 FAD-binding protein [Nodosilinea sp. LEGE 07298]
MKGGAEIVRLSSLNIKVEAIETSKFSHYRTNHLFERFGEIHTPQDLKEYCLWAEENKVKIYILGNGSNTLFVGKRINSLVLKNKLEKYLKPLPGNRLEVSSSSQVMDVLKYCQEHSLSSFYYLSSVPATVGGALAMNAGRGESYHQTIYDFVESVTYLDGGDVKTVMKNQLEISHRTTMFTGRHSKLILSAVLKFTPEVFEKSPVQERQVWSKEHQDNIAPNCGSVFKRANFSILRRLQGIAFGKTQYSKKTTNWILNKSSSSNSILVLIWLAKLLHFINGNSNDIELELIEVD